MFGVGPGSLIYDAVKMGLKAEDQRRKLEESLDVVMELMQGRIVTKKTDWFDLRGARLQLKSYSDGDGGRIITLSGWSTSGWQVWHWDALDRWHIG